MSDKTDHLNLPYILPSQAQKHVTHNEALRLLDAIVHLSVKSMKIGIPPDSPEEGDRYVVGENPSGAWNGLTGQVAAFVDNAWMYFQPETGWLAWDQDIGQLVLFAEHGWAPVVTDAADMQDFLGINASASEQERLVVQSRSVLFNHDGADHHMKLNKATEAGTAGMLFQTGYSGRVELGLPGSDDFVIKVSDNGTDWNEAIRVDKTTGELEFPSSVIQTSSGWLLNLLPDSGRFLSPSEQHQINSTAAHEPGYVNPTNGATLSFPFRFINDNSTFGGSAGQLDPVVERLITEIYGPVGRRYGPEFWCMEITSGSGTYWNWQHNGEQFYNATLVSKTPRPEKYTSGFFVCAIAGKLAVRTSDNKTRKLLRNGDPASPWTEDVVLDPQAGWQYFELQVDGADGTPDETDLSVMITPGGSGYYALPRVVPGWVSIGPMPAILLNDQIFEA